MVRNQLLPTARATQSVVSTRCRLLKFCARSRQGGAASTEYALVTALIIATLFLPLPGSEYSVVGYCLNALRQFQANTTYLLSLP